jgi:hypothetical protein
VTGEQEWIIAGYLAKRPHLFATAVLWNGPPTDRALTGWPAAGAAFPHTVMDGMTAARAVEALELA